LLKFHHILYIKIVLACAEDRAAFTHLLDNGFALEADNFQSVAPIKEGYADIHDVLILRGEDINLSVLRCT
jgi:hypothetical protein